MSKDSFFAPIDLPDPPAEDVTADYSVPNWPSPKKFSKVIEQISTEINKVTQGTSKFTPHGIDFTTGIQSGKEHGFIHVWNQFKSDPTKEKMEVFLDMAEQDINLRAKREFKTWLDTVTKGKK